MDSPALVPTPPAFVVSSAAALVRSLAGARSAALEGYLLPPGPVRHALEDASERGTGVRVTLAGAAAGRAGGAGVLRANAGAAAELRRHGVDVHLSCGTEPVEHLKGAVVDGVCYLDGRNWNTGDLVVRTADPAVAAALDGTGDPPPGFAVEKAAALRLEAGVIAGADRVDVATESFGGCEISAALRARAVAGASVRLLVAPEELRGPRGARELALLRGLAAAGVAVRTSAFNDKLAVADGRAWLGSANATDPAVRMRDWGLATADPSLVAAAEARFEGDWSASRPLPGLGAGSQLRLRTGGVSSD